MEEEGFSQNQNTNTGDNFEIYLKELSGQATTVTVNRNSTVKEVKNQFLKKLNRGDNVMVTLSLSGKTLADDKTLSDYNISEDDTIHVLIRMRGGM